MTEIEELLEEIERQEADNEMYFSLTYIPPYYQPEE